MNQTKIKHICAGWAILGVPVVYLGCLQLQYSLFGLPQGLVQEAALLLLPGTGAVGVARWMESLGGIRWALAAVYWLAMAVALLIGGLMVSCLNGDCL